MEDTSLSCSNTTSALWNSDYKNLILRFGVWPALFRHSHARRCFLLEIGAMNVVYVKEFKHAELFSKVWGEIAFVKGK